MFFKLGAGTNNEDHLKVGMIVPSGRYLDCFIFGYKLPNRQLHVLFCGGCLGFIRLLVESASIKKEMSYVPK